MTFAVILVVTGCGNTKTPSPTTLPPTTTSTSATTTSTPTATPTTTSSPTITTSTVPQPTPSQIDRAIYVDYSPTFVQQGGKGFYLVCYVKITNQGYNDFISTPSEFNVVVKGNLYHCDISLSDLPTVDMKPGSKILGLLAFPVPNDTETAGWAWWHAQQNDNFDFIYREQPRQSLTNG